MFATRFFTSMIVLGDHWSVWEFENDRRHRYKVQNFNENLLFPMRGFLAHKSLSWYIVIPLHPNQDRLPLGK